MEFYFLLTFLYALLHFEYAFYAMHTCKTITQALEHQAVVLSYACITHLL